LIQKIYVPFVEMGIIANVAFNNRNGDTNDRYLLDDLLY